MALLSDAVMVLFCDVASDPAGHDDWHTYEHMHERLSIPGFIRGSRWVREAGGPRYLILYEVDSLAIAQSPDYLERLNHPTAWTQATMKRLRGMSRGFCTVAASAGYGLGRAAFAMRFARPSAQAWAWLTNEAGRVAALPGLASAWLLDPGPPPPMTTEQSIRGRDAELGCLFIATAHDRDALPEATATLAAGIAPIDQGLYALGFTATAAEVRRTAANPPRSRSPGYR